MAACIFTVVIGGYDTVFPPRSIPRGLDRLFFTDASPESPRPRGWTYRAVGDASTTGRLLQRKLKVLGTPVAGEYDYSIYVDGNVRIIGDILPLLEEFKRSGKPAGFFRHPWRSTIAEEADACVFHRRIAGDEITVMRRQVALYAEEGFPDDQGLLENGVFFRWHRHPDLQPAMEAWYRQIAEHCIRDQISLPYVLWKTKLPIHIWDWAYSAPNSYFKLHDHRPAAYSSFKTYIEVTRADSAAHSAVYWVHSNVRQALRRLKGRV